MLVQDTSAGCKTEKKNRNEKQQSQSCSHTILLQHEGDRRQHGIVVYVLFTLLSIRFTKRECHIPHWTKFVCRCSAMRLPVQERRRIPIPRPRPDSTSESQNRSLRIWVGSWGGRRENGFVICIGFQADVHFGHVLHPLSSWRSPNLFFLRQGGTPLLPMLFKSRAPG